MEKKLVQCATPEAVIRLQLGTELAPDSIDWESVYFDEQPHNKLPEFMAKKLLIDETRKMFQVTP